MDFGGLRLHTPPCTPAASTPPSGRTSRSAARGAWDLESCQESPTRHVLKHAILSGIRRWLQDHTESCRRGVGLQDVLKTEQRSPETKLGNISTSLIDRCWSAVAASWRMDGELPTPAVRSTQHATPGLIPRCRDAGRWRGGDPPTWASARTRMRTDTSADAVIL